MKNLMIYYGWLSSFGLYYDNEKAAQDLAQYDLLVFGDGVQTPTHTDYSNAQTIIARIKVLNPKAMIFGYVTLNQSFSNFKTKVDDWNDLEVSGIFIDESGYDFGTTSTNSRSKFNEKIDFVHSQSHSSVCFVNAWKPEHIWGENGDSSYPDSTWNADDLKSNLTANDWFLYESLAIDTNENYESHTQWAARLDHYIPMNKAAVSVIADNKSDGNDRMKFIWISALMHRLDGCGASDTNFGASSGKGKLWPRPDTLGIAVNDPVNNSTKYFSYLTGGRYILDFASGSETATIEIY